MRITSKNERKIIKIDHFYSTNHAATAQFVETAMDIHTLVQVVACLQFKFEELVDETLAMDERHIIQLLEQFFDVKDVTDSYQIYHSQTTLPDNKWDVTNTFTVQTKDKNNIDITQIDLYAAREFFCGPLYKESMAAVLPNTHEFENGITDLTFYPEYKEGLLK